MDGSYHQHPAPTPPHPQTRSGKAAMAFARFAQPFGIGTSRPPSSSGTGSHNVPQSAPRPAPMASRTTRLALDSPVQAFSADQDGERVVIAGRDFLRVVNVVQDTLQESYSIRIPGGSRRGFLQSEVKWGCAPMSDVIATASISGSVSLYKDGRYDRTLNEHHRQINRLAFNPADGKLLLSASQDGSIKLWDLREKKSRFTFQCKAEAVRDVQFNGANAVEFAAAFENGSVQRWDYRNPNTCERKISNAHQGAVYSVAWHPDGKHCASAGRDKTVKVWDFYADARRKAKHTINAQMSVAKVVWRPLGLKTTELATCSINLDYRIHIWDLKRPYMPTYILNEHTNAITGLQFKDEDILWSGSKDMTFVHNDIVFGHQPISSLPQVAFAWNHENEFTFAGQRRKRINKSGHPTVNLEDDFALRPAEEERKRLGRSSSYRGSGSKPAAQVSALEGLMEKFHPSQATARVNLPIFNFDTFEFLAKHYVTTLMDKDGMKIGKACMKNAKAAYLMGEVRTATTWKMLGYILQREEDAWIEKHEREEREQQRRAQELLANSGGGAIVARRLLGLGGQHYINYGGTPQSRPVPDTPKPTPTPTPVHMDNMINIDEALVLPPAAFGASISSSTASTDGDSSPRHFPEDDFDMDSNTGRPSSPRPILQLDLGPRAFQPQSPLHRPTSNDSSNEPFFSTSDERVNPGSNSPNRRNMEDQVPPSPYEAPRTRPRQYSIGLVSEQTSSSYEDRVLGELQDSRDEEFRNMSASGLESLRNNLHAIVEEKEGLSGGTPRPGLSYGGGGGGGSYNSSSGRLGNAGFSHPNMNPASHSYAGNTPNYGNYGSSNLGPGGGGGGATGGGGGGGGVGGGGGGGISNFNSNNSLGAGGSSQAINQSTIDDGTIPKEWSSENLIPELLHYYTEKGDVQFCATLINLLYQPPPAPLPKKKPGAATTTTTTTHNTIGLLPPLPKKKFEPPPRPEYATERQIDEWVEGYVDLLHRRRLLSVAAQVSKWSPSEAVRQRGQMDTFVHTSCCWCEKPLVKMGGREGGWGCEGCKRRQDGCVICRKEVRGRWVMCQICGHGGHDDCLRDWFFGSVRESSSGGTASSGTGTVGARGKEQRQRTPAGGVGSEQHSHGHNTTGTVVAETSTYGGGGAGSGCEEEDTSSDEDDREPMEMCPAVGCAHECLPRPSDYYESFTSSTGAYGSFDRGSGGGGGGVAGDRGSGGGGGGGFNTPGIMTTTHSVAHSVR